MSRIVWKLYSLTLPHIRAKVNAVKPEFIRFYLVSDKIILYNKHVFTGDLIFIIKEAKKYMGGFFGVASKKDCIWELYLVCEHRWRFLKR